MKTQFIKYTTLILLFFIASAVSAQTPKANNGKGNKTGNTAATLTVQGECGMCKRRIEEAAAKAGAKKPVWDEKTQTLSFTYNSNKLTKEAIGKAIAAVGHDNEIQRADDAVYNKLHGCCHYRDSK